MIRIAAGSDLHLGITKWEHIQEALHRDVIPYKPDAVLLLGDNAEGWPRLISLLASIRDELERHGCGKAKRAFLLGNHDLWERGPGSMSSTNIWSTALAYDWASVGWTYLERDDIFLTDPSPGAEKKFVAVTGTIGWFDYSAKDPSLAYSDGWYEQHREEITNDARFMPGFMDNRSFAKDRLDSLCEKLAILHADTSVLSHVVVGTHVPCFEPQIVRKPGNIDWNVGNAFFGNLTLGKEIEKWPKVSHVISGHTHHGRHDIWPRANGASFETIVIPSEYRDPHFVRVEI